MLRDSYDEKKCILVCAGEFDTKKQIIEYDNNCIVIAVDGGLSYCRALGIEPQIIVGDFDSASEEDSAYIEAVSSTDKKASERIIRMPREKDDTDTIAAIRKGLALGCTYFELYGAMGGRIDHYFANIQALLFIKHHGAEGIMYGSDGEIFIIENESVSIAAREEGTVSIFVLGDTAGGVTIRGLYYEVEDAELTNDYPIGISNEFCNRDVFISVRKGSLVCMIGSGDR